MSEGYKDFPDTFSGHLALLTLFLRRSVQGLGMLAASQDFAVTRLMGISANRVIMAASTWG